MAGFLFSGGGAAATLPVFNVKTGYGARGDGTTDDTTAIQNAINAAIDAGGGIVYFPPNNGGSQIYLITSSLVFSHASASTPIQLVGEPSIGGSVGSTIGGVFSGYLISHPAGQQVLRRVYGLNFINGHASGKGVLWNDSQTGIIEECTFSVGFWGIASYNNSYCLQIRNCNFSCSGDHPVGSIGVMCTQTSILNCSITGFDEAVRCYNAGFSIKGTRLEVNRTAIFLGKDETGSLSSIQGFTIQDCQTERCDTAIYQHSGAGGLVSGCTWTGTVGIYHNISGITWSGSVATVTSTTSLDSQGWTSGTRPIRIESSNPAGYDAGGFVTGTYVDSTHFTYAVASNPGAWVSGSLWSFKPQYGMRIRNATACVYSGITIPMSLSAEGYGIDLVVDGGTSYGVPGVTFVGVNGGTWNMPPANARSSFTYVNCDNTTSAMTFADLPGQGSNYNSPAVEGMEYSITDGAKSGGGTAALSDAVQGSGAQHIKVRRTNSAWVYSAA